MPTWTRGLPTSPDKIAAIVRAFEAGHSIPEVIAITDCGRTAVRRYKRLAVIPPCGCGLPGDHSQWCPIRVAKSPGKQAYDRKRRMRHAPLRKVARMVRERLPVEVRAMLLTVGVAI